MSLYDDASLIMFPSGYKEDKIYSLKPTDGSGDLTFTRASTATRVNSDGLIETSPVNLLQYSEEFDNASWVKTNLTVTTNTTTAPNGTTTADSLTTQSTGQCNLIRNLSYNVGVHTMSIYVKKVDTPFIYVEMGSSFVWFNLTTGENSGGSQYSSDWAFVSATSENVGNGWFRFQMVAECLTAGNYGFRPFQPVNSSGNYTPSAINEVTYLWGAQLNIGSTAKPYFPTTDRLNVPRIDYTGGGCGKLLLENQRTNLYTYSEQIYNAAWGKTNATITANSTISPDGTQNADKVIADTTNGVHRIEQDKATATQVATQSVFAKANGYNFIAVENGGELAYFNISTGVVGSVSGGTASIQDYGNGWYRCILTATALNTKSYIYICSADNVITFAGDGTSGVYLWAAQFEANASYVSSYIPTLASSVTRLADKAFKTGISSLIGQTEGTIFMEFEFDYSDSNTQVLFKANQTTDANSVGIEVQGTTIKGLVNSGGGNIATITGTIATGTIKAALAYKTNDMAFYVNGTQLGVDTSGSIAFAGVVDIVTIGQFLLNGSSFFPASRLFNQALIFKTRLTNDQLADITGGNITTFNALATLYGYTIL
jgi:hypothetical protein